MPRGETYRNRNIVESRDVVQLKDFGISKKKEGEEKK